MIRLEEVREALRRLLHGEQPQSGPPPAGFSKVVCDSRESGEGALFVALPGERTDGHHFLDDALSRGAKGLIISTRWAGDVPQSAYTFRVDDTLEALQQLARHHREQIGLKVIGVTGSVGKTTTKEVTAGLLSKKYRVLQSQRSFNSEIGLPLTMLEMEPEHQVAVLEMGMYVPGDIKVLCDLARPEIGIVTNVGYSHLERTGSLERTTDAKAELVESLPTGGLAVLNGDDARTRSMTSRTAAQSLLYGLEDGNDVRATDVETHGLEGIAFTLHYQGAHAAMRTPLAGAHNAYACLAAAAVAFHLGFSLQEVADGLGELHIQQRLQPVPGINGSLILDDTYNASPASMKAALDVLRQASGRKIAILGDMRELGSYEQAGHEEAGTYAAQVADLILAVGNLGRIIGQSAEAEGRMVLFAADTDQAVDLATNTVRQGDTVLVKGSRAMEMERIVKWLREGKA